MLVYKCMDEKTSEVKGSYQQTEYSPTHNNSRADSVRNRRLCIKIKCTHTNPQVE